MPNITGVIKSGTTARHVVCKGRKKEYTVLFGKADGRTLFGRRRLMVEDHIKIVPNTRRNCINYILLSYDRNTFWTVSKPADFIKSTIP